MLRAIERQVQSLGSAVVIVAQHFAFVHEVPGDGLDAQGADAVEVRFDGHLSFARILRQRGRQNRRSIDQRIIENPVAA